MYIIKRKEVKVPSVLKNIYATYNEARNAIRKWLRLQEKKGKLIRSPKDVANHTVTIGEHGFSVLKHS